MEYSKEQLPYLLICKTAIYEGKPLINVFQDVDCLINKYLSLDERNQYKNILSSIWVMEVDDYEHRFKKTWKKDSKYNIPGHDEQ